MIQARTFGALLALGALTALPGCSYFGGGQSGSRYSAATPATRYNAPAQTKEAAVTAPAKNVQQPITTAMVRRVQTRLRQDGMYHGRIDGLWGPESREAAVDYQRRHHLNPTGKIDLPMLQAMNLSNSNQQYGENSGRGSAGHAGSNANQQFGQANNGAPNGRIPPDRNFTTGGQNNGNMNASNMPYQNNNGRPPATGATGGTAANGSNTSNGYAGTDNGSGNGNGNNGGQQR